MEQHTFTKNQLLFTVWSLGLLVAVLVAGCVWPWSGAQAQGRKAAAWQRAALTGQADGKAPAGQASARALFSPQERSVALLGAGNPVAQMLVLRELNRAFPLSPQQRASLQALAHEAQPLLQSLREKRGRQERALEEAIYGENFDAKAVEQLMNEAAETQKELLKQQTAVEARFVRLLMQENRGQTRYYMLLSELVVGPKRNQIPTAMLVTRQFTGQWRMLQEMFGEDMEMLIPSFSNPLSVLLVMRQLELRPEQKTEFKALAQEVRTQLLEEREAQNGAVRGAPARNDLSPNERLLERLESRERMVGEVADRQVRMMKRQVHIETRIRQILNPKQWSDYTTLLRAMLAGNFAGAFPNNPANTLGRPMLPAQPPNLKNLRQEQRPPHARPFEQQ
jgi:Spy/CpxP family protein refolding chaperone